MLSVGRFNKRAASGDMHAILMNAVAGSSRNTYRRPAGVAVGPGMVKTQPSARWSGDCRIVGASLLRKPRMYASILMRYSSYGQRAVCLDRPGRPRDQGALRPVARRARSPGRFGGRRPWSQRPWSACLDGPGAAKSSSGRIQRGASPGHGG